jgi:hypothetical protein
LGADAGASRLGGGGGGSALAEAAFRPIAAPRIAPAAVTATKAVLVKIINAHLDV